MGKYCQNPLCENEAVKQVPVSVREASDQKRSLCAACEEAYSWGVQHGTTSQKGLLIEPPPKEAGPEPLYRVVYVIDVNAADVRDAAEYTHRIMTDPSSLPPVLHVLDHQGRDMTMDLATESPGVATQCRSDVSHEKARRFVQAGGTRCPGCDSEVIDFGRLDVDAECAYQEACCCNCKSKFCAVYRLVGYGLYIGDSFEVHTIPEDVGGIRGDKG